MQGTITLMFLRPLLIICFYFGTSSAVYSTMLTQSVNNQVHVLTCTADGATSMEWGLRVFKSRQTLRISADLLKVSTLRQVTFEGIALSSTISAGSQYGSLIKSTLEVSSSFSKGNDVFVRCFGVGDNYVGGNNYVDSFQRTAYISFFYLPTQFYPDFGDDNSSNSTDYQDDGMNYENSRESSNGVDGDPTENSTTTTSTDNGMDNANSNGMDRIENSTNSDPTAATDLPTNNTTTTSNDIWIVVAVLTAVIMITTIVAVVCCFICKCRRKNPTKEHIDPNQISSSQSQGRASDAAVQNAIQTHDPKYSELNYVYTSVMEGTSMSEDNTATSTSPVVIWMSGYSDGSTIYNDSYGMLMFDNIAYRALYGGGVTSSMNMNTHGDVNNLTNNN